MFYIAILELQQDWMISKSSKSLLLIKEGTCVCFISGMIQSVFLFLITQYNFDSVDVTRNEFVAYIVYKQVWIPHYSLDAWCLILHERAELMRTFKDDEDWDTPADKIWHDWSAPGGVWKGESNDHLQVVPEKGKNLRRQYVYVEPKVR